MGNPGRTRATQLAAWAIFGALAQGCVMQAGDAEELEQGDEQALGESRFALGEAAFVQLDWQQGDAAKRDLKPTTTHWCTLTGVAGKFRGAGEELRVVANKTRQMWELHGKSQQTGVRGTATCYERADFTGVGSAPVQIVSIEYLTKDYGGNCPPWPWACGDSAAFPESTKTWQGDAVLMLSGISGDFRGDGEFVWAYQAKNGVSHNTLQAQSDVEEDHVFAYGHNFFIGEVGAGLSAQFYRGDELMGSANLTSEYEAGGIDGVQSIRMVDADLAFCYLTRVQGSLSSAETSANIKLGSDGAWYLEVRGTSGARVKARARCMALDQRPLAEP
jgi:hypothetical protein